MCNFFSCTSDGKGNILYFDAETRRKIRAKELNYEADSHTSINDYFGFIGAKEDERNKYEFNPLTGRFIIDQLNTVNDSKLVEEQVRQLNFGELVPELILKPIVHPFQTVPTKMDYLPLLKEWASVWASVRDSVWASVWAYSSSFFDLTEWKYCDFEYSDNPFQSCITMWENGVVPSFDGNIWRLHTRGGIILEISKQDLMKQ